MVKVLGVDKDDPEPSLPWASRLEMAELMELACRKRQEHCMVNPRRKRIYYTILYYTILYYTILY